jgi:RNA polymerase sigma factor (sigma-70 family)
MDRLSDILDGCRRNDRKSQQAFYYQFYPALFNLCKKFFADDHDIQTALNNGMMRVFKNIGQYNSAKGDLFNWVYTIIRNSCLTILRDRKTDHILEYKDELTEAIISDPFANSDWEDIFGYLNRLPPATRAVCSLFYLEEFPVKEIAKEMNLSEGTIKWHLSESRKRLKEMFRQTKN